MFSHVNFKRPSSHCLESSPGELNKMQNSIGGDSVHSYTVSWCPLESAGLPSDFLLLSGCFWWTLTAGLVTFRRTVRLESPSDSPVWQACTGKSPDSHRKIAAPPELKIRILDRLSPTESARKTRGSVKTSRKGIFHCQLLLRPALVID